MINVAVDFQVAIDSRMNLKLLRLSGRQICDQVKDTREEVDDDDACVEIAIPMTRNNDC